MTTAGAAAEATRAARPPLWQTYLIILLTTLFWGGTAVGGKLLIQDVRPLTAGVLRYGLTAILLLLCFGPQLPSFRTLRSRDRWLLFWIGVFGTFLNHSFFFFALSFAPAAHGALIPSTSSPVWTMLLAQRRGGERIGWIQAVGMILCLIGVVLVIRPARLLTGTGYGVLFGDLLFIIGGVAWGIYSYLSAVAMHRLSAVTTLAYGMIVGTIFLVPVALIERPWATLRFEHVSAWIALAFLVLACTLVAFLWWNMALARVGAGRTAVFTNLVPAFGILLSWLLLGERLTAVQLFGGALSVVGVIACQFGGAAGERVSIARR
ncbi:MAG TPA: DMT family transporter [Candidatus Baltobacteraceae bacterium]|nr:DMT family transporter [Candidatus Baltobacteraceae bacterium]